MSKKVAFFDMRTPKMAFYARKTPFFDHIASQGINHFFTAGSASRAALKLAP
jgi:hypothetical protein